MKERVSTGMQRVLIVDDIEDNRFILSRMLGCFNVVVDVAESGFKALELFDKQSYYHIFLDMRMPGMDGLETLSRIRQQEEARGLSKTMITAITASYTKDFKEECLSSGCNYFLSKPALKKDLAYVLNFKDLF